MLGREVQLQTGEADRGPQFLFRSTGREVRRIPAPNLYDELGGAGSMDPSVDTVKSYGGGPGRAGSGSGGACHGACGDGKRRGEALDGSAEAVYGYQDVGSLFSSAAVALVSLRVIQ